MMVSKSELLRISDYILKNDKIIISEKGLFNKETLEIITQIITNEIPNNFELSKEQEKLLLTAFIENGNVFEKGTPRLILEDEDSAIISIKRDIKSLVFIKNFTENIKKAIFEEIKRQTYILTEDSPTFLKFNLGIVILSIKACPESANYVLWNKFDEKTQRDLIKIVIESGFVITEHTSTFLMSKKDIVLSSIKKNPSCAFFIPPFIRKEPEIFKILLLNNWNFSHREMDDMKISILHDDMILDAYLKNYFYIIDDEIYNDRIRKIFKAIINNKPLIKNFNGIFQMNAELNWDSYRSKNLNMFENIFGKICGQLQCDSSYEDSIKELNFLPEMLDTLDKKLGEELNNALQQYYRIYHDKSFENKTQTLQSLKDIISKCSSMYISKTKEEYKKKKLDEYIKIIKPFFELKMDNPTIKKKIISVKQREMFKILYLYNYSNIKKDIQSIINKFINQIDEVTILKFIEEFIIFKSSNIDDIISQPIRFNEYIEYEETFRLINRLNNNYITFDGIEVKPYKHLIGYNQETKKYYYNGKEFIPDEIEPLENYKKLSIIFNKIIKEIMILTKKLEIDENISDDELDKINNDLPFSDENYQFNFKNIDNLRFSTFIDYLLGTESSIYHDCFINNYSFEIIFDLLINNNLSEFLIMINILINSCEFSNDIENTATNFKRNGIDQEEIKRIIDTMPNLIDAAKDLKIELSTISNVFDVYRVNRFADKSKIAILGKEIIGKLYMETSFTNFDNERIINWAEQLVCAMAKRNYSTVPHIFGEYLNYKYSLYDLHDENILLAGINTDSCFRIDGNDNDFLHYCALDKNGFVIKITDYFGNFIGRASGFRNGNSLYLNQLRTIFDEHGNNYKGRYKSEQTDIINALKKACQEIFNASQNNPNEVEKIDFIFITQSYSLKNIDSNVSEEVKNEIGEYPMDSDSDDWDDFTNSTDNLVDDPYTFTTDYESDYSLICLASIKDTGDIKPEDIKPSNVPALYQRKRKEIIINDQLDFDIIKKVKKINALYCYHNDKEYQEINIPENSIVYLGDDWYIITNNREIIAECLLDFDNRATCEFNEIYNIIEQNKSAFTMKLVNFN